MSSGSFSLVNAKLDSFEQASELVKFLAINCNVELDKHDINELTKMNTFLIGDVWFSIPLTAPEGWPVTFNNYMYDEFRIYEANNCWQVWCCTELSFYNILNKYLNYKFEGLEFFPVYHTISETGVRFEDFCPNKVIDYNKIKIKSDKTVIKRLFKEEYTLIYDLMLMSKKEMGERYFKSLMSKLNILEKYRFLKNTGVSQYQLEEYQKAHYDFTKSLYKEVPEILDRVIKRKIEDDKRKRDEKARREEVENAFKELDL